MAAEDTTSQPRPNSAIETLLEFERTKKIVEYLLVHLQEIMEQEALKIIFDCKGKAVRVTRAGSEDL